MTNFTDCVFDSLHSLYNLGARNFVLQNIAPLQFAPLYADAAHGGSPGPSNFWRTKGDNITEISQDMRDLVQAVNQIWDFQAPFAVENELKGANLAVFDSYGLVRATSSRLVSWGKFKYGGLIIVSYACRCSIFIITRQII